MDATNAVDEIEVTWAATSSDPAKRRRIGKIWKPKVKWPVTPGAKRKAYVFECARYPDLEAFRVDLDARMRDGGFALVAGWLKPNLDPLQTHPRRALNFVDGPSWLLSLDFDGLAAANSMRLDRPEDFGAGAWREARRRLPAAFDANCVLYATSSTGLPVNAKGEPANGCARFRVVFWLSRPLSFAEQRQITLALKALPGLDCLDDAVCTVTQFSFIARPVFPNGMADPIETPALVFKGAQRRLDVALLLSVIDAELPSKRGPGQRSPGSAEERRLDVDPELRVLLVRQAVDAIVNNLDRRDWVKFMHAVDGAVDDDPEARDIVLGFSARWEEDADPYEVVTDWTDADPGEGEEIDLEEEAERVWDTRGPGRAGFRHLLEFLAKQGTPEAEAALAAIQLEGARWAFRDPPPEDPDDENDDDDDDDALLARRAPTIDPRAFYGILDTIVTETTRESEATKVGVAAQAMAHVSLAMRPFYNPLGNIKLPFNLYSVQLGLSGKGRKGTSAAIADDFLGPALLRQALLQSTRIAFADEDGDARREAEAEVEKTARRLSWTKTVGVDRESEIEARLVQLREEHAAATWAIGERKAYLRTRIRALRTVRDYEKLIAAAEVKRDDAAGSIAVKEAELAEVRRALKDQEAALRQAKAAHDAAVAKLDGLPPPAAAVPWLALFASMAEGPVTARGVSTGEGLIELIRDPGQKQGMRGPVHDPGVANKCLFLNLDELGSVLAVSMRPGATLSSVLRTMFDCHKTELINKNSPTRCNEPYLVISASITPGELIGRLFDKRDAASSADNGLGNRFLYLWVQRDKLKARPLATPGLDAMMDAIAGNVFGVYEALKPEGPFLSTPIDFSAGAYARYEREYPRIANLRAAGRRAAKLIERLPVYLRKIAGILAVMNGEHEISEGALEAAIAWVEYAAGTVNAIATSATERKHAKTLADDGETILAALKSLGGDKKPVSSRDVQRKTLLDKKRFDAAVNELALQGPAPISIGGVEYVSGRGGRRSRAMLTLNTPAAVEDEV